MKFVLFASGAAVLFFSASAFATQTQSFFCEENIEGASSTSTPILMSDGSLQLSWGQSHNGGPMIYEMITMTQDASGTKSLITLSFKDSSGRQALQAYPVLDSQNLDASVELESNGVKASVVCHASRAASH